MIFDSYEMVVVMWRWIVALLLVAGASYGGYWLIKHPELLTGTPDKPKPIATTQASPRDIEQSILATGDVRPILSSDIKSEVSGRINKVYVLAGDKVQKGDLLVDLDPSELLTQQKANLLTIKGVELRLKKTQEEWDRNQELHKKHLIPEKDYLDSRTELEMAANDRAIEDARLQTINEQLKKTTIKAPQEGVVLNLEAQEGSVIIGASSVSAGSVLMSIANLTRLRINTSINEIDVTYLQAGLPVDLSFDSIPGLKVAGKITFVSPSAAGSGSASSGSSSGSSGGGRGSGTDSSIRTFPVTIELNSTDPRIRPGITATIIIPIAKATQVLSLPISTVYIDDTNEQRYVFVKNGSNDEGDIFERKSVTTGINDTQFVELKAGLTGTEEVAMERPKIKGEVRKEKPRKPQNNQY